MVERGEADRRRVPPPVGESTGRLVLAALGVTLAHFVVTVVTLPSAYTMAMSDFDGGPTVMSRLGHVLAWVVDHVLLQPLHPLSRRDAPWSLGRGYMGLALNSAAWGLATGTVLAILRIVRTRRSTRSAVTTPART